MSSLAQLGRFVALVQVTIIHNSDKSLRIKISQINKEDLSFSNKEDKEKEKFGEIIRNDYFV